MNTPSPVMELVPDLVTMLMAGPAVQPNSAEKAVENAVNSWIAPTGIVAIAVWRERRGAARSGAGREVRRVDEQVARAFRLPERRIEQRQRRHLAAQDRR